MSRGAAISCIPFPRGTLASSIPTDLPLPLFPACLSPLSSLSFTRLSIRPFTSSFSSFLFSSSSLPSSSSSSSLLFPLERGRKKIRDDCWDNSGECGSETTVEPDERGIRREKLHPFGSHPQTPSGLKKSIKRRGTRRGGRELSRRRVGVEEGGKEREKEGRKVAWRGGLPSRLFCQVDEAGKDEKTDGERRNLQ